MATDMLSTIKTALRIKHNALDDDIQADIDACLSDLRLCGVVYADSSDPLILNAVKLYCRSMHSDDTAKSAEWLKRYEALKGSLMMAKGYAWEDGDE